MYNVYVYVCTYIIIHLINMRKTNKYEQTFIVNFMALQVFTAALLLENKKVLPCAYLNPNWSSSQTLYMEIQNNSETSYPEKDKNI
jgi:hypothetical protein